ncbi:uncharacterized protein LOC134830540 [Culicoides brevitarsis]|uniref:uncharacterized protein LOC134830540 n=1 Tax=Culicoides brevitarsis TaxID=469753 RepID=UPI00307B84BA
MVFKPKTNICNLLCAKQQGFCVTKKLKELAFSKAERLFLDKAIESEECQLKQITSLPENLRSTFSIEFSADGKYFATCHSSRILYVLNAFTLVVKWKIITDRTVWCMNFHPHTDAGILAVGTVKSKVYIYKDGVLHRKYVELANNDDDNLTPIASIQFEPESFFLIFSNRHQIYFYDWENDVILKVISAVPDTVVRFIKFIPGNSSHLLTTTTKTIIREKLHVTALAAYTTGDSWKLLEVFMIIVNFVLETMEQYKGGNNRCWSYSIGIQYFIRLFYYVTDFMEKIDGLTDDEGISDLKFTLKCLQRRIDVINQNFGTLEYQNFTPTKDKCGRFFAELHDASNVIVEIEKMCKVFEHLTTKTMSLDDLYVEYEKALWKDGANMPRWPKLYHYVQYWNIEKDLNLKQFHSNLITVSGDTTIAVVNDFFVSFNPLLQVIEVISTQKETFGQRLHVLQHFPNFYYFLSVSPTRKILFIGFKKGLPGYNFETYGIFYELDKPFSEQRVKSLKTDKNWDINCLQFAPNPITGLIFGYNGPLMFRLAQS